MSPPSLFQLPRLLLADFWGTLAAAARGRALWLLGAALALGLDLFSYAFFQGRLKLAPCSECVLIRAYWIFVMAGGLLGAVYPRSLWASLAAGAVAFYGLAAGLWRTLILEAINLEAVSDPNFFPLCGSGRVKFPWGIPFDRVSPALFQATGACGGDSLWSLGGFTMTQWLILIYGVALAALFLALAARLYERARRARPF
ncbi:MAG: disulfide bond formation protein B [Deltaproteobacteria bacterium]|jgi:disulfide bond formation protein DsbB|nr:disulfide bond formation protein B [Deltaproteobacteria bacterium]